MGVFEENKKKREEYVDAFYAKWDKYCSENHIHHDSDKSLQYENLEGKELFYIDTPEELLGWYLMLYDKEEYKIPEILTDSYSLEDDNINQLITDATILFYQSACSLKESLDVNDMVVNQGEKNGEEYLQFYFRTTNQFKEIEEMVNSNEIKKELVKLYKKEGEPFTEEELKDDLFLSLYGNFYESSKCELYFTYQHHLLENDVKYNLLEYLSKEDVEVFWDEVKKTDEWKEFEESFEKEKDRQ